MEAATEALAGPMLLVVVMEAWAMPTMAAKVWVGKATVMEAISTVMVRAALLKAITNSSMVVLVVVVVVVVVLVVVLLLAILRGTEGRTRDSKDKHLGKLDKLDNPVSSIRDRDPLVARMVVWVSLDGTPIFPAVVLLSNPVACVRQDD